ncbi:MAG: hypothetical protein Q8N35_09610 [Methylococcaceae bacterium]|nr:hypothetical protein [Methylococcaceae bacterium]MDZ4156231.1 hypothetical protein [Methylococcales bacterium]MDP2393809.1 hypothetical protein [Methylococcaceae bacterium]MDP3019835.1 hypothetical protein [Methylococcaceae bacterium]MDP3389560.1 hypothetical protein [Methylococcaceae bacterium]
MHYKKIGCIVFSLISPLAFAVEQRAAIKFNALPEAVRITVSNSMAQDSISNIEKVTDTGYVKFEIVSTKTVNNKTLIDTDMIVAADGAIIKMTKEAPYFDIPFPVMNQLNQRYPNLKVDEVESVQTRYFHLTGKNNGQSINLKIFDDGEIQDLTVGQNSKNNSSSKQLLDQTVTAPTMPKQGE